MEDTPSISAHPRYLTTSPIHGDKIREEADLIREKLREETKDNHDFSAWLAKDRQAIRDEIHKLSQDAQTPQKKKKKTPKKESTSKKNKVTFYDPIDQSFGHTDHGNPGTCL